MNTNNDIKNYSAEDISRYWQGKLSSEEMHAMERAAMDDPFLADAMEGYSTANPQKVTNDLAELRERLQERGSETKVVPMRRKWWRVAAVIILLGGAAALTWQLLDKNNAHDNLVQNNKEAKSSVPAENAATPKLKDSLGPIQNEIVLADTLAGNNTYLTPSYNYSTKPATKQQSKDESARFGATTTDAASQPAIPDLSAYKKNTDTSHVVAAVKDDARGDSLIIARNEAERNARSEERANVYRSNVPANQANLPPPNRDNNRAFYLNNFSGRVIDADNNAIPQASLRVNNNSQVATTDNNGYFNIRSGDTLLDLSIASAGYQSRQLTLRSNQPSDVVLDPVPQKKSAKEGYGVNADFKKATSPKSKEDDKSLKVYPMEAVPVIGWDKYSRYLAMNNRLMKDTASTAEVVVSFSVSKNGKLSSFNIEKSAGKEHDAEALRLIKEGPEWRVLKGRKTKARVIVAF